MQKLGMLRAIAIGLLAFSAACGCRTSMHLSLFGTKRSHARLAFDSPEASLDDRSVLEKPTAWGPEAKSDSTDSVVLASSELPTAKDDSPTAPATQAIDLTTALLLTSGQNPQIAFARARIEESNAQLDRALAMKMPSLRAGLNYNKHEGRIQDVRGDIIETSRGSFFSGLGANAVGAGSPAVPGIVSQFHFADAVFQPRIAQRTVCARRAGADATTNDALYSTAVAYIELMRAQQELAIQRESLVESEKLARATEEFAKTGQGLVADHDRARTEVALRKVELLRAEELVQTAALRLAEVIHWDGSSRLEASETHLVPLSLVSLEDAPSELVSQALAGRPELRESQHLVGEAVERLNRERNAPWLPSVLLAGSYGGLGGGLGSQLTNYGDRFDGDAVAYWEVRQMGLGENASRRESKARIQQAKQRELALMDKVAREVVEAQVQVRSRFQQMELSQQAIAAAQDSYDRNWDRVRNGKGLPIEMIQSLQALQLARREYSRNVADHNIAQFSLCRALGWPVDVAP